MFCPASARRWNIWYEPINAAEVALAPDHLTCGRGYGGAQERTGARCLAEDGAVLAQAVAGRRRQVRGLRTARRCARSGAPATTRRANLRGGGDDMRETVGERTPISQWTQREIADEAIRRGLVPKISQRSVGRFLKRGRPQAPSHPLLADSEPDPHLIASARISVRFTRPLPGPMILTARSPSTK